MKIGLVVPGFSKSESDWCIPALLGLVRRLAERDEVHVFTLRYPKPRRTYSVYGATVHAAAGGFARGLGRVPMLARTFRSIGREHRRAPFHVLHGFWADEPGFVAVRAARRLEVPAVVTLLGGELVALPEIRYGSQLSYVNRVLVRHALASAARVTAGSRYLAKLAEPWVSPDRLHQLPLGVDTKLFRPETPRDERPPLREGDIPLLHVASLVPVKNQAMILRALARVAARAPAVHLHIVGEGPLRRELEQLADALGVRSRLTFHGAVLHHHLPAYYRAARLCVMGSRHEGQEWVTLEAAACGRPTVGTAVGLVPDLEPVTRAVPVGDDEALAAAVSSSLAEASATGERSRAARLRIERDYSLDATVEQLRSLYQETFHQFRGAPPPRSLRDSLRSRCARAEGS